MEVLISGNLSSLATSLTKAFLFEKYKVVLVGSEASELKFDSPNVRLYSVSPAVDFFEEILSAHKFDVVIYLAAREETLLGKKQNRTGQMLDGLTNTLELCKREHVKKVFYVSSTEIYGNQEHRSEEDDPQPASPNGFSLKTGEQYCSLYSEQYGLTTIAVRVPYIYGQSEKATLLYDTINKCKTRKTVVLPGRADDSCAFLHADDVTGFILNALEDPGYGFQVVNLPSIDAFTFAEFAALLQPSFPEVKFGFATSGKTFTQQAVGKIAKRNFDWLAERKLVNELPGIILEAGLERKPKKTLYEQLKVRFPKYTFYLKWAEVFLGAALMNYLNAISGSFVEFRFFDFRLIYVVLLGTVYGTQVGLVASFFAAVSLLLSWNELGLDWTELIYNVSNWLPFALYVTAAMITGYFHDKKENDVKNQSEQISLIQEKYKFLYDLYQEVLELKNQFHKQLVGSRDSFGRIFTIARELDTLEEEEVIFKALHILEDVMDNRSIAIYSINQGNNYARLEIYSSSLAGQIKKSLDLKNYPALMESIEKSEIFQNRALQEGYPAYFVPVNNGSRTLAAVVIWDASFDQYSLYYYNLLKVICGLIQSSINRVSLFMDANADKLYIPNTRILQPEPFMKVLKVKDKMKKNKLGDSLLVMVVSNNHENGNKSWEKVYALLAKETRAEDYIGLLDDGNCYILFSQADHTNASTILQRLARHGITGCPVEDQQMLFPSPNVDSAYPAIEQVNV